MKRIRPKFKEGALGDWRHAIFKRVVSPTSPQPSSLKDKCNLQTPPQIAKETDFKGLRTKKTCQEIRDLWRNAIRQQILLNRMDKQNYILKAQQKEVLGKRVKLSYVPMGVCDDEASDTWDSIISKAQQNPGTVCDVELLNSAILRGIPKHKRGQVWQFFIQQRSITKFGTSRVSSEQDVPYNQLRRKLTSHQHSILIDLGRTFPSHPFFCDPLGTGQLALFNLLKAYSILDPDVGYCQGLSFVAGILLMHMEEEEAFAVLKYLMLDLGAREHYKPEMDGLQIKLYQLTRLMHDQDSEVQLFLYQQDVLPSLYAAPWFLTMFASQFSVGFAVRVLDVVLLHGIDMITKFAAAIIVDHKSDLIKCTGLEQVMECFRHQVTKLRSDDVNRYLRKVLEKDSDKQLLTYAVEYSVMHDESFVEYISDGYSTPSSSAIRAKRHTDKSQLAASNTACDDCLKLQHDIFVLLQYIEEFQVTGTQRVGNTPLYPPEISALANKYSPDKTKVVAKFDNGINHSKLNTLDTPEPVQRFCADSGESTDNSGIFHVHSFSTKCTEGDRSIEIPVQNDINRDDRTHDNTIGKKYLIY